MDLDALARTHGQFFVPGFTVLIGSEDLVRDLNLTVTSVEVDLKERAAARFTFKIANAFSWELRQFVAGRAEQVVDLIELFAFGAPVNVRIGYGEPANHVSLLRGLITEIGTSFASGGTPELTISGYDQLYPLTTGKNTRSWENKPDSVAVQDIAGDYALAAAVTPHAAGEAADRPEPGDRPRLPPQARPAQPRHDLLPARRLALLRTAAQRGGRADRARLGQGAARLHARGQPRRAGEHGRGGRADAPRRGSDRSRDSWRRDGARQPA